MLFLTSLLLSGLTVWANPCSTILQGYRSLSENRSFAFTDLPVGLVVLDQLQTQKLSRSGEYNRFGELRRLREDLPGFFESIGLNDQDSQQALIEATVEIVEEVLRSAGGESGWVALRAFTATSAYDVPRWHTDGRFFVSPGRQAKFAAVFFGPPTLFVSPPFDLREEFVKVQRRQDISIGEKRKLLAKILAPVQVEQPSLGQGAWFEVGHDLAAIHSEPMIQGDRLFLSIVPGTHAQIADLKKRWGF